MQTFFLVREYVELKKKIFANYHLKGIPYTYITIEDLIAWSKSCDYCRLRDDVEVCPECGGRSFADACIAIDEAHVFFDSRTSSTKLNRIFSYMVLQTGKENINLYYTTQDFGQIEKRLRQRTDIGIHVRKRGNHHYLHINDHTDPLRARPRKAVVYGPDVYEFYNTKEVVKYVETEHLLKTRKT